MILFEFNKRAEISQSQMPRIFNKVVGRENSPGLEITSGLPYFRLEQPIYQTIFIDSLKYFDVANYYFIKFACVADISLKY